MKGFREKRTTYTLLYNFMALDGYIRVLYFLNRRENGLEYKRKDFILPFLVVLLCHSADSSFYNNTRLNSFHSTGE